MGCRKQAQSRTGGLRKSCFAQSRLTNPARGADNVPILGERGSVDNERRINTTQGAHYVDMLGDRGFYNNAAVSRQPGATLFDRCHSTPSMAYVAYLENMIYNNAAVSHQLGATSFDRCHSTPSLAYVAHLENTMVAMNSRLLYVESLVKHRQYDFMGTPGNVAPGFSTFSGSSQGSNPEFPTGLSYFSSESPLDNDNQTDPLLNLASDQGDAATAIPTDPPIQPTSKRIRTLRTHQQVLTRLARNESDETANPGLSNSGVICYANAIF
jgi:hypothetical protein